MVFEFEVWHKYWTHGDGSPITAADITAAVEVILDQDRNALMGPVQTQARTETFGQRTAVIVQAERMSANLDNDRLAAYFGIPPNSSTQVVNK